MIGSGNWNQSGRSHDALLVKWQKGKTSVQAAWAHHERGEPIQWSPYTNALNYQDLALWRFSKVGSRGEANVLLIFDSYDARVGASPSNRWTGGLHGKCSLAGTELRGEAYYQTGRHQSFAPDGSPDFRFDISAFMVGFSASRITGPVTTTLWYDYLSGDDDAMDDRIEYFVPLYGTFHRFYGWADYFDSFPGDTRGYGLQDYALKFTIDGPGNSSTSLDLHYFTLAELQQIPANLGFEADAMIKIPLLRALSLSVGASLALPGEAMKRLKGNADQGHWVWTMLDFNVK